MPHFVTLTFRNLLFLFLILSVFTSYSQFSAEKWKYRQEIIIDNSSSNLPLTDHQINMGWNTERLLQHGKIDETGNDIRITDSDRKTLLCFWIENEIGQSNTKIWCKIPYVEAGEVKTVYLYYGFQGEGPVVSAANAHCTFYLFDDFTGHTLDTTKWSTLGSGQVRIAKGRAFIQSENTDMILHSKKAFSMPVIAEMQLTTSDGKYVSFALVQEKNSYEGYALALDHPQKKMKLSYLDPEWFSPCGGYGFMPDLNYKSAGATEGIWSIASITANTIMGSWAGGSLLAENVIIFQEKVNLALGTLACQNGQHAAMEADWVRVRNLALNPPQIWIGSEHLTDGAPFSDAPVHAPEI